MSDASTFTAFLGDRRVAAGPLPRIASAIADLDLRGAPVFIFDDATGRSVDLDMRQGPAAAVADYERRIAPPPPPKPGRGRPRLGVVAREITLLPRHWDWLAAQPGGASATLRRLVDDARRANADIDQTRESRDAVYRVMSALAGDLPGFEEASRALFSGDHSRFAEFVATWPRDVADYVSCLATPLSSASIAG